MADALIFDGIDDNVIVSPGQIVGTGALTFVAVVKLSGIAAWNSMIHYNALVAQGFMVRADNSLLAYADAGTYSNSTFTVLAAEGWVLLAFSKPAGSSAGKHHKYVYGTAAWLHQTGSTAVPSPPAPTAIGLGGNATDGDFFTGSQMLTGVWDRELADLEIEALTGGLKAWIQAGPVEAWRFDTLSPIRSQITTSAQTARTGTTLDPGDIPAGWTDSLNPGVTPPAQRNAFPFMARGDRLVEGRGSVLGNRATGGPRPAGGFERFIYPRLHPIPGTTLTADIADSATPDDAAAFTVTVTLVLSDSTTTADAATRTTAKALSDSAIPADAATRSTTKTIADSAALADSSAEGASLVTSDSAAPTDAATRSTTKALSDSATPSDAATRTITLSLADSAALSDSSAEGTTLVTSDTVGVADARVAAVTIAKSDSVTPTDATSTTPTAAIADTTSVADAAARTLAHAEGDTVTATDAATFALVLLLEISDSVIVTDSAADGPHVATSDTATTSDAVTLTLTQALSDSVAATDVRTASAMLALSDSATVSDNATAGLVTLLDLADTVTLADNLTSTVTPAGQQTAFGSLMPTTRTHSVKIRDAVTVSDRFTPGPLVEDQILAEDDEFARLWLLELV